MMCVSSQDHVTNKPEEAVTTANIKKFVPHGSLVKNAFIIGKLYENTQPTGNLK